MTINTNDINVTVSDQGKAYGCIFCSTGKEQAVAEQINLMMDDVEAKAARQMKYKSKDGVKSIVVQTILPGYVFFQANEDFESFEKFPKDYVIRILRADRDIWQMSGSDEAFARWLWHYDGLLSLSKAYQVDGWVYFPSGPLHDLSDHVVKVDKRGRSAQVILHFLGREYKYWLCYEWTDKPEDADEDQKKESSAE